MPIRSYGQVAAAALAEKASRSTGSVGAGSRGLDWLALWPIRPCGAYSIKYAAIYIYIYIMMSICEYMIICMLEIIFTCPLFNSITMI